MTKALSATCAAKIVKVGPIPLPDAKILSEGVGQSQGVVYIDEESQYYIADTTPDLKVTLDKIAQGLSTVATALTQAAAGLTAHGTAFAGLGVSPDPAAVSITAINNAVTNLNAPTGPIVALQNLKEQLR